MKTATILKFIKNPIYPFIVFFTTVCIWPVQAQTVRDHRNKPKKTVVRDHKNQTTFKPLNHYWNGSRKDNQLTATIEGKNGALGADYRFVRQDGYVLEKASSIEGQAVPLYLYYSDARKDNFTTATTEGIRAAKAAGYKKVRVQGYILKNVKPKYQHLYKPLWLYYHDTRKDNFTIATAEGRSVAEAGGYRKVRIEGYILNALDNNHQIELTTALSARYLNNYPSDRGNGWSDKLQGVGHNDANWFFTQKERLWKFPISHDLNKHISRSNLPSGVKTVSIPNVLSSKGYNHFGDLVEYKGFLFIPLEAEHNSYGKVVSYVGIEVDSPKNGKNPLIAVFRASDLSYVGSGALPAQTKAGWCAIHPQNGMLYTSNNSMNIDNKLLVYTMDLEALKENRKWLKYSGSKDLLDENGNIITIKEYMQGGEFSDDGKFLFIINGKGTDFNKKDGGIWVFNFKTRRKALKSETSGIFKYEFNPGYNMEEPEGLTYWDLDNLNAPGIKGKLHAILLNSDATSSDEFWFKHYDLKSVRVSLYGN